MVSAGFNSLFVQSYTCEVLHLFYRGWITSHLLLSLPSFWHVSVLHVSLRFNTVQGAHRKVHLGVNKVFECWKRFKFLADLDCPGGERGLQVWQRCGHRGAVDVWGDWGGEWRGHLGLKGVGHGYCGVRGGHWWGGIWGVDRGGVAGGDRWGVRGDWWWIRGDGGGVAGGGWSCRYRCCRYHHGTCLLCLLVLLPKVDLGVPLSLIAAGKLASTDLTSKRFLTRVRADVCCQVVATAEVAHADTALEGLLACVDADVTSQLVWAWEAAVTSFYGTSVWPLMRRGLAGPCGVLAHTTGLNQLWLVDTF